MDPQQLTQHLNNATPQDYAQAALALASGYQQVQQQVQQQSQQQQQQQFVQNPQQYQQYAQVQQYQQQLQQYTASHNPQQYVQQYVQSQHNMASGGGAAAAPGVAATASTTNNGLLQPGRPARPPSYTKKGKLKDPNRPKRPTSAYFFFLASKREEARLRGQNISKVAEWTKQVSAIWREMGLEEKNHFEAMAVADKKRYELEKQSYSGRRPKDKNRPKRPQSSYFCFLGVYREKNKSNFTGEGAHKALIKAAAEAWNSLTPADKVPYECMAEQEKRKYEDIMKIYNAGGLTPRKEPTSTSTSSPQEQQQTAQQQLQQLQQQLQQQASSGQEHLQQQHAGYSSSAAAMASTSSSSSSAAERAVTAAAENSPGADEDDEEEEEEEDDEDEGDAE